MQFEFSDAIAVLQNTPSTLNQLLGDLPAHWTNQNEGENTWSPFDVMGHLTHGEKTEWMARINKCLGNDTDNHFAKFDRFAQFEESKGKTMNDLLKEFETWRMKNLIQLKKMNITPAQLDTIGVHPAFGEVTLRQLLSTWVAHDLGHIGQIVRVMAKLYKGEVVLWKEYLSILNK